METPFNDIPFAQSSFSSDLFSLKMTGLGQMELVMTRGTQLSSAVERGLLALALFRNPNVHFNNQLSCEVQQIVFVSGIRANFLLKGEIGNVFLSMCKVLTFSAQVFILSILPKHEKEEKKRGKKENILLFTIKKENGMIEMTAF